MLLVLWGVLILSTVRADEPADDRFSDLDDTDDLVGDEPLFQSSSEEDTDDAEVEPDQHTTPFVRPRTPQPEHLRVVSRDYTIELVVVALLVVYFGYFWLRKEANAEVVTEYANAIYPVFQQTDRVDPNAKLGLMSVSYNQYVIETRATRHTAGTALSFNMRKRQEPFVTLFDMLRDTPDELVIDAIPDDKTPPCIFAVFPQKGAARMARLFPEVSRFCKPREARLAGITGPFVVYSDAAECKALATPVLRDFLAQHGATLRYFVLSDQSEAVSGQRRLLRCGVRLGKKKAARAAVEMTLGYAENIHATKIDPVVLRRCIKVRAELAAEELKRAEKKRREEFAERQEELRYQKLNAMSADERRRYEERERSKMLRRKQVKVKVPS